MKLPEAHEKQVFLPFGHKLPLRGRRQLHLCERDIQREREGESIREDCILLRTVSPMLKNSYSSNSHWEQRW